MEQRQTDLRHLWLLDDPTGRTVTSSGETRAAAPGERYHFAELGESLARATGVPAAVGAAPPAPLELHTAAIVPAPQLERWLTVLGTGVLAPAVVAVDVPRTAILRVLTMGAVAAIEHHQYWAWQTHERA